MSSNIHIRNMRSLLKADYRRHIELHGYSPSAPPGLFSRLFILFRSPGLFAVFVQRLVYLYDTGYCGASWSPMKYYIRLAVAPFNYLRQILLKIYISKDLSIGPGLVLSDRGQIIVGARSIGANCTLNHKVTIGVGGRDREKPTLGDNVYVESGTLIFGGIRIGNNVTIKAGTVCSKNIPDNCIVEGNPARIKMLQEGR